VREIRYALTAVRGVGRGLVQQIVRERAERGPYRSMDDFCRRLLHGNYSHLGLHVFFSAIEIEIR
ncbi:MAG: hypothetical protein II542_04780, partial [Bacteroidales bacterium]|nr:hypothetical protein [Bacteroidales bacterium]